MATTSPRSSPAPTHIDLPTNENAIDANSVTEAPAVSIDVDLHKNKSIAPEHIQDEIKPDNASDEHVVSIEGGLARNVSNIVEQAPGNGIKANNANDPAVSIEGRLNKMSDTLGEILDVLKGSTIAEEIGKDDSSKFWATYKKVSTEYDKDFVERANDDMAIILIFAGLFCAVNSTFIVGMQPNPGDTTNALLLYQIQRSANGPNSVPDINTLSPSTGFPSSTVWVQTLAYASLAFSLLAAFGAVLGKQWLHSYMTNRGRGNLEERGIERQMKLDGVEHFRLETILQTFLVLLQISLLLFGLSLSANMWFKQTTISKVIISTTAFGILFYVGTTLVSALHSDSPFQVSGPGLFTAICKRMLPKKFTSTPSTFGSNAFGKSSAVRWILGTSTNPEVVDAVAGIVPFVQWPPNLDASAVFARLRNNLRACRDKEELYVKCGKAMAHLCIQPVEINKKLLWLAVDDKFWSHRNRFIRDAFMAGRDAYNQLENTQEIDAQRKHRSSVRTAVRTMVVYGQQMQLARPDDESLIWDGDLRWHHSNKHEPSCQEFDWLIDYLADASTDNEAEGDTLLALSAMGGLGSSTKRLSYIKSLIRCMGSGRPHRVRHTALRASCEAREELASITSASMSQDVDLAQLMDELSRAIYTAVCPNGDNTPFLFERDFRYTRLIGALAQNSEWLQRLTQDVHVNRCIYLVDVCPINGEFGDHYFKFIHLVTLSRIKSSGKDLPFNPSQERWQKFIVKGWAYAYWDYNADMLLDLVAVTRLNLTAPYDDIPREWLIDLATKVTQMYSKGRSDLGGRIAKPKTSAALSSMQGLYAELSHMIEQRNTSTGASGS